MKYNIKELQDLTFLYIIFSYIDTELRSNGWVVQINGINELSVKAKNNNKFFVIENTYFLTKNLNMFLNKYDIVPTSQKGKIIAKIAGDVIEKAFIKISTDIVASYLGFVGLLKYSEYKYKKLKFLFNENFVIDYINEVNDRYWKKDKELSSAINNSEKVVNEVFKIIYATSFVGKKLRNCK